MAYFIRLVFALGVGFLISACASLATDHHSPGPSWRLAYAHDETGAVVEGSKAALIAAARNGKPVRVYFRGARVEHVLDAGFLTILENEIFAQIAPIQTQRPSVEPPVIEFREPGQQWRAIVGSDGSFRAFADGGAVNSRKRAIRWFVQD